MSADPAKPLFDCLRCGACCLCSDVPLGDGEAEMFERRADLVHLTVLQPYIGGQTLRWMRHSSGDRCAALAGELGHVRCTIYPDRPMLCREVEPGSDYCLDARRRYGLPTEPET